MFRVLQSHVRTTYSSTAEERSGDIETHCPTFEGRDQSDMVVANIPMDSYYGSLFFCSSDASARLQLRTHLL